MEEYTENCESIQLSRLKKKENFFVPSKTSQTSWRCSDIEILNVNIIHLSIESDIAYIIYNVGMHREVMYIL